MHMKNKNINVLILRSLFLRHIMQVKIFPNTPIRVIRSEHIPRALYKIFKNKASIRINKINNSLEMSEM